MPRVLVATTNPDKVREIRAILGDAYDLMTLGDVPPVTAPEETGRTFAENARLKARYYATATGLMTLAEDSGLEVDALGGAPGVESARYGGENACYEQKFKMLYDALAAAGSADRSARFVCAVAIADGDVIVAESRGTIEGEVAPEPRGEGGFGYDPIFYCPPFGCTLAEAGLRKHEVSHRAAAMTCIRAFLDRRD
ncbi:MAG: RdgB/HAM1 family non-canonical purine NTP pyrophosphatase [Vicinamibacterales bacterium]